MSNTVRFDIPAVIHEARSQAMGAALVLARFGALSVFSVSAAQAQSVTAIPVDIGFPTPVIDVFNYKYSANRIFSGVSNATKVALSAFVFPSPDTDVSPFVSPFDGRSYLSTNGAATSVSFSHPALGGGPVMLPFIGSSSGLGGFPNAYATWLLDRTGSGDNSTLDALASTNIQVTVSNPLAPNGVTSRSYSAAPYDKAALPGFVTDVALTSGEGLSPTLSWKLPSGIGNASNGFASPYYFQQSILLYQFEVDASSGNVSKVNLVHKEFLALGTTSYTFDFNDQKAFSSSSQSGFPSGLEAGKNYAAAVQIGQYRLGDRVPPGGSGDRNFDGSFDLLGVSEKTVEFRTRVEPIETDPEAPAVFLPSVDPEGVFHFDIGVQVGQQVLIDPAVAIGYDYQIGVGDPLFKSVTLPAIGDGLFDLYLFNGTDYSFAAVLTAGEEYLFGGLGVDRFRVLGIETSAALDPTDPTAFVTALTFAGNGRFTGTQTPLTFDSVAVPVPEPETYALMLAGLGVVGAVVRKRSRQPG